jgi:hypothetical protein
MFDKGEWYSSGFADAILSLNGSNNLCLEQTLEVLLPCGWITTAVNYRKILQRWKHDGCPIHQETLTEAYLDEASRLFSGLTKGVGCRSQPWLNHSLTSSGIRTGLKRLRQIVEECNGSEKPSYASIHQSLMMIKGVGSLGAQHLIGILSLIAVIPPEYGAFASIATTTNTAKKIRKYYGLTATECEHLKRAVASHLHINEAVLPVRIFP